MHRFSDPLHSAPSRTRLGRKAGMAASAQQGYSQEHWTAQGWMKGAALVIGLLAPIVGLVVIVPALVSAGRAGTSRTVYVVALALNLVPLVLTVVTAIAANVLIQPS